MQLKISSNTSTDFLKRTELLVLVPKQISVTHGLAVTALVEFDRRLIRLEGFNSPLMCILGPFF